MLPLLLVVAFLKNICDFNLSEKQKILFLLGYNSDEIIINTNIRLIYAWKILELFSIENGFAKYFAKHRNLFV